MILAKNVELKQGYKTNQNVLLVGSPGSGKTRSHVLPNLLEMDCSMAVLDPKGELFKSSAEAMKKREFKVKMINFDEPSKSLNKYNPLSYCKTTDDIITLSSMLVSDCIDSKKSDPFWTSSGRMLCNALIDYILNYNNNASKTIQSLAAVLSNVDSCEDESVMDKIFGRIRSLYGSSTFAYQQYKLCRKSAQRTMASIIISLAAEFSGILTPEISHLTSEDTLEIDKLGDEKTILYIICSDSDRSKNKLVSLLFMQIFRELYKVADRSEDGCLKNHVHFFLDDLGTTLNIPSLDSYLCSCRSREISMSIVLQSIEQLRKYYEQSYTAIVNSCNSYVFLGGMDLETCKDISERLNVPLSDVLYKKPNEIFVFTQGEKPIIAARYDVSKHKNYKLLKESKIKEKELDK